MSRSLCRFDTFTDCPCSEKYVKKLVGRTDIEDALKRLEKLSHDETLTATMQVLKLTDGVDNKMEAVVDGARGVF